MIPPLSVGSILANRYKVIAIVSDDGGMARVYEVRDVNGSPSSTWAMKQLRPRDSKADPRESIDLFNKEADLLRSLSHHNIPQFRDRFDEDGNAYLVLEFISGQPISKVLLGRGRPLDEEEVMRWGFQICEVLEYLHTRHPPIIYRDLKPDNLMVTSDGVVKIIDFGIARTHKKGKAKDTVLMGTEAYAPPEQYGAGQTDARADVYALGATMYHLLTNNYPPNARLPIEPTPIRTLNPKISRDAERIVVRAMQKDRSQRYQSAAEMRDAIAVVVPGVEHKDKSDRRPAPVVAPVTVPPKSCLVCGTSCRFEARFCTRCGHSFSGLSPSVLRVIQPYGANWEMPVPSQRPIVLGTTSGGGSPNLDLSFYDKDGFISRTHARIHVEGAVYKITDLGSTNGTKVNGAPLAPNVSRVLHNGDLVELGRVILQFRLL